MRTHEHHLVRYLPRSVVITIGVAGAVFFSSLPASASVTTNSYSIGSPSGVVSGFVASPTTVGAGATDSFAVRFIPGTTLAGTAHDWVTLTPSVNLGSAPFNVQLVSSACSQTTTAGDAGPGSAALNGLTIDLADSCTIVGTNQVQIDFTAEGPISGGTFTFSLTTSKDPTPATSNSILVSPSGPTLFADSYGPGASTTYFIGNVSVSSATTSLVLNAVPTQGKGTIAFTSSSNGAGYGVSYTSSGAAASDLVQSAVASGASVTLTLSDPLSNASVAIVAQGTNPPGAAGAQADDITVQAGGGTPEATNPITFGGSVNTVAVGLSNPLAGAKTLYVVDFNAAHAVSRGGSITVSEHSGPTNFSTVKAAYVVDVSGGWQAAAVKPALSRGSATLPVPHAIAAGDSVSLLLTNVANPASAGPVDDFTVSTTGDPVPATATSYSVLAKGSSGSAVTLSTVAPGGVATYSISNLRASGALSAGKSTIKLGAPSGTVFPSKARYFSVTDLSTPAHSGFATGSLTGGGTDSAAFAVPKNVKSGDLLVITVGDVTNPNTTGTSNSITVGGNVTG